jgi:hypothetical protein
VKDASKRRRNTYAGIRRPTISEGSDPSVTNDSPQRAGSEGKTCKTVAVVPEALSSQLPSQDAEHNLEMKTSSDISAAVSPRTRTDDVQVQHLITPVGLEHEEKEPLTATRITMDIDKDIENHVHGLKPDSDSSPTSRLLQIHSEDTRSHNDNRSNSNDNLMSPDCIGLTSRKNYEDIRPDMSMLSMYSSTFSSLRTPLQTPQLSSTMSTPQIDTPEQPDFHAYGLGVQIPMHGVGMSFGVQSLMDHHMGGIPHSIPEDPGNSLQTPTNAISHSNLQGEQTGCSDADLTLHRKLDSFPHLNAAGVTNVGTFSDCNSTAGHPIPGLNEDMLTGMDVSMSMALDMGNGGGVATNAMALHPFTWA